ncbi:MAG: hypothetical protein KKE37_12410 [Verrucomicrobia bacterium]|nr:hypothetical protein [Verrucomicrobiota bacterium]MBU4430140.1 hypothetical protein [Verrucomicrobiota bacterium]MCG2681047.1 hypothetical protein [Kiritimatiellia bacterium]
MNMMLELSSDVLRWIILTSLYASLLILLIFAAQWLFRRQLAPRWKYLLWGLVALRLIPPCCPPADSVYST